MHTPASIFGHPVHPMLAHLAIGGLVLSFAFDLARLFTLDPDLWSTLALYAMYAGIVGALLAAIPGVVDLVSLPAGPVRNAAITYMVINLIVVALFLLNAWLRVTHMPNFPIPIALSLAAIVLLTGSGWLSGKLACEHEVKVVAGRDLQIPEEATYVSATALVGNTPGRAKLRSTLPSATRELPAPLPGLLSAWPAGRLSPARVSRAAAAAALTDRRSPRRGPAAAR